VAYEEDEESMIGFGCRPWRCELAATHKYIVAAVAMAVMGIVALLLSR
jgi:hypothetical protein